MTNQLPGYGNNSVVISIPGFLAPEWASGVSRIEKRPNFHIVRRIRNWKEPQYLKEALKVKQIVCIEQFEPPPPHLTPPLIKGALGVLNYGRECAKLKGKK